MLKMMGVLEKWSTGVMVRRKENRSIRSFLALSQAPVQAEEDRFPIETAMESSFSKSSGVICLDCLYAASDETDSDKDANAI